MPWADWLLLGLVTLVAAGAQGATGFGFALLVVSFYLAILNSTAAVQLAITGSLAISLALAPGLWRVSPRGLLIRLCLGTLVGLPLGILAYRSASLEAIKVVVACLIIGFAGYLLLVRRPGGEAAAGTHAVADLGVGLVSGAMATGLGMPGPAVLLYLQATGAAKQATRATTLSLFVFSYLGALALQAGLVGIAPGIWLAAALLAPLALLGAIGGHLLSRRLDERVFRTAVLAILLAAGAYTLWSAIVF